MGAGHPPQARIRKSSEFSRMREGGERIHAPNFLLVVSDAPGEISRLGLIVTKKVEPRATRRNYLKRRLREIFRRHREEFRRNVDLLIVARRDSTKLEFAEIREQVLAALRKGKLLARTNDASDRN